MDCGRTRTQIRQNHGTLDGERKRQGPARPSESYGRRPEAGRERHKISWANQQLPFIRRGRGGCRVGRRPACPGAPGAALRRPFRTAGGLTERITKSRACLASGPPQERTGTAPQGYRSREFVEGQEISFLFLESFLQRSPACQ